MCLYEHKKYACNFFVFKTKHEKKVASLKYFKNDLRSKFHHKIDLINVVIFNK